MRSVESIASTVAVFGTGEMAGEYLRALHALDRHGDNLVVAGRSRPKTENLAAKFGAAHRVLGDTRPWKPTDAAIIAVTQDAIPAVAEEALALGVKRILVEKPGALSSRRLRQLAGAFGKAGASGYVAFNRRFFPSVEYCRNAIDADGGCVACYFEMTEVERLVLAEQDTKNLPSSVLDRWGLANATHVLDLAFHLIGMPAQMHAFRAGSLPWHSTGAVFAGSGVSGRGALFSYLGTWGTAGRWRVEVTTPARRLILCPLETVREQKKGSFEETPVRLEPAQSGLKPGLEGMLQNFLGSRVDPARLPDLISTAELLAEAEKILGYQ